MRRGGSTRTAGGRPRARRTRRRRRAPCTWEPPARAERRGGERGSATTGRARSLARARTTERTKPTPRARARTAPAGAHDDALPAVEGAVVVALALARAVRHVEQAREPGPRFERAHDGLRRVVQRAAAVAHHRVRPRVPRRLGDERAERVDAVLQRPRRHVSHRPNLPGLTGEKPLMAMMRAAAGGRGPRASGWPRPRREKALRRRPGALALQSRGDRCICTPLHAAASGGHVEVVRLLVHAGADATLGNS